MYCEGGGAQLDSGTSRASVLCAGSPALGGKYVKGGHHWEHVFPTAFLVERRHHWEHVFPTAFPDKPLNVKGEPLKPCVQEGSGKTGFNRDNMCIDPSGADQDHHEVCAAINPQFWKESGQGDPGQDAPHGHWCICVHKYSNWLNLTNGKGSGIESIDCDATAKQALEQKDPAAEKAIADHCNLKNSKHADH